MCQKYIRNQYDEKTNRSLNAKSNKGISKLPSCEAVHIKVCTAYRFIFIQIKLIFI